MGRLRSAIGVLFCFSLVQILLHQRTWSSSSLSSLKVAVVSNFDETRKAVALHNSPKGYDDLIRRSKYNHHHQSTYSNNNMINHTEPHRNSNQEVLLSRPILHALTGGELPLSPYNDYTDPSTWPAIDNETCRHKRTNHRPDENNGQSMPYFKWQRRAPYAMVLGTMKGAYI
jgi:hypothetical protein